MDGAGMMLLAPQLDRLTQVYRRQAGVANVYGIDRIVKYVRSQGLLDNFRLYPMIEGSGSTVYGIGNLTSNNMTLVNGPTWGASGLAFASASSQYGSIPDFLGSESLYVFARVIKNNETSAGLKTIVSQYDTGAGKRSFIFAQNGSLTNDPMILARDSVGDGSGVEAYEDGFADFGVDHCFVTAWEAASGLSMWTDKISRGLSLYAGSAQTNRANVDVPITLNCFLNSGTPTNFSNQTAKALCFLTGTVTTTQRETLTDLINAL